MKISEARLYLEHTSIDDFNLEEHQRQNRYEAIQVLLNTIDKAVEIYDDTITYLTTINGEYMDSNTKRTIQDVVNNLEKELNILNGRSDE